jgi:very-short-patch-repair endonuclease
LGKSRLPNLRARELRWNMTEAERKLWRLLRCKRLAGFRFRRQATLGPYIADFFCPKARPIVELDGSQHAEDEQVVHDEISTRWLNAHGCRVVRFWNVDVFKRPNDVVDVIYRVLTENSPPTTS